MEGYGTTTWATTADVRRAGLFKKNGVVLGRWWCGWRWRILRYQGDETVIVVAPERSGKGTGIFIPTLLSVEDGHTITIDIRGATYAATAGYLKTRSRVLRMALMHKGSARFSLPQAIRTGTPFEFLDAAAIAEMHVDTGDRANDKKDFWDKTSKALLTCVLLYEVHTELRPTIHHIAKLWSKPGRDMRETLKTIVRHAPTPEVAELGQEVLNKTEREASSVLSTMMSNLFLYRDRTFAENTSTCDFRLEDFMQEQYWHSLFVVQAPAEEEHVTMYLRAFFKLALGRWMQVGEQRNILMLLDEYPNLGAMDFHIRYLSVLGGYGIRTVIAAQNIPQLKQLCGDPDVILEKCKVRVFYAAQGQTTGREIARQAGTGTAVTMQESYRANGWSWAIADSRTQQEHHHSRDLVTAAEATEIPGNVAVAKVTGYPPIWGYKAPFWRHRRTKKRSKIPA